MKTLTKPCTRRGRANSGQHHSKRQGRQNLVLQSKAEEDHHDQEIIIHLQFISKVTITTCTYTDYFPSHLRAVCHIPLCT